MRERGWQADESMVAVETVPWFSIDGDHGFGHGCWGEEGWEAGVRAAMAKAQREEGSCLPVHAPVVWHGDREADRSHLIGR